MSKSKYTRESMIRVLTDLSHAMAAEASHFPACAAVSVALAEAAKDPTQTAESTKVPVKPKAKAAKPIAIAYDGKTLAVTGVPWGQAGLAIKQALNAIVGVETKTTNPETGRPFFKSCWDKKNKCFRLPLEKASEVLDLFESKGMAINHSA